MSWAKFDDRFLTNPKVMQAGLEPRALYMASVIYCAGELTDGHVPRGVILKLCALSDVANIESSVGRLLELGLWEETEETGGGYMVHDYLDYNPTKEKVADTRKEREIAGARGGNKKASNSQKATGDEEGAIAF